MNVDILINITPMETRVAYLENASVQEIWLERHLNRGIVGNIYQGQVVRVLPGMQAAFVDIGLERTAFIHAADITSDKASTQSIPIQNRVYEGQTLTVQATKDPIGTKGARLTTQLSIPARYLVYMPDAEQLGISQRIEDETERERLRHLVNEAQEAAQINQGAFILRTAAEGIGAHEIGSDLNYLKRAYGVLQERIREAKAPSLIYEELPLYMRVMRDLVRSDSVNVRIDSKETFAKVIEFIRKYTPEVEPLCQHYPGERPIFDLFSVEDELKKALEPKVELKSGGYLIIEQTEAMSTIDINTGGFVGYRNLEETLFKTNLEAVTAIARQLRLRNLGGLIIIDFIDMTNSEHQRQVLRMLEKQLEKDHAKTKISNLSELGLVEMTRQRTRESLAQQLTEPCRVCAGKGHTKTAQTLCYDIFREILREERAYQTEQYSVLASAAVIDRLLDEEACHLADLEEFIGKPIKLQVEPQYHLEQFDIILK